MFAFAEMSFQYGLFSGDMLIFVGGASGGAPGKMCSFHPANSFGKNQRGQHHCWLGSKKLEQSPKFSVPLSWICSWTFQRVPNGLRGVN